MGSFAALGGGNMTGLDPEDPEADLLGPNFFATKISASKYNDQFVTAILSQIIYK